MRKQPPNRPDMSAQPATEYRMKSGDSITCTLYQLTSGFHRVKAEVRVIQSASRLVIESAE